MLPSWLRAPGEHPFDTVPFVGIAVREVGDDGQRHVGIVHRAEAESARLLDLGWHHVLRDRELTGKAAYLWVATSVHELLARSVAAWCRRIAARQAAGGLPYGIAYRPLTASIDPIGRVDLGGLVGLTCATFVLVVFERAGVLLVDVASWPPRPEDVAWQFQIVAALERDGVSAGHVDRIRADVGCARFRPEEVAGGAAMRDLPASFEEAAKAGRLISQALEARR